MAAGVHFSMEAFQQWQVKQEKMNHHSYQQAPPQCAGLWRPRRECDAVRCNTTLGGAERAVYNILL